MGLPSKKRTKRSQRERRAHHGLSTVTVTYDKDGNAQLPHRANPTTGKYKGKAVVNTTKRAARHARAHKSS
jgi:ribosomal protein L32